MVETNAIVSTRPCDGTVTEYTITSRRVVIIIIIIIIIINKHNYNYHHSAITRRHCCATSRTVSVDDRSTIPAMPFDATSSATTTDCDDSHDGIDTLLPTFVQQTRLQERSIFSTSTLDITADCDRVTTTRTITIVLFGALTGHGCT